MSTLGNQYDEGQLAVRFEITNSAHFMVSRLAVLLYLFFKEKYYCTYCLITRDYSLPCTRTVSNGMTILLASSSPGLLSRVFGTITPEECEPSQC